MEIPADSLKLTCQRTISALPVATLTCLRVRPYNPAVLPASARNLRALKEVGILDVLLVVGCQGDAIDGAVGQLNCDGLNVRCLPTPDWRSGNGVSLMRAQAAASDEARFLVLMADHLLEVNTLRDFLLRVPDN